MNKNTYENRTPSTLSLGDKNRIFEIIQDMWARGIGEYLQCMECDKIYGKQNIYGIKGIQEIPDSIRNETVQKIEETLGFIPQCECGGDTKHLYGDNYFKNTIEKRYSMPESYLSLAYNSQGNIIGFMDGYISKLRDIFQNEFSDHFTEELLDFIYQKFEINENTSLLTVTSIGTDDKNKSLSIIFSLLKEFFSQFDDSYNSLPCIIESIIGSSTYAIFDIMGAEKLHVQQQEKLILKGVKNTEYDMDILFQKSAIKDYKYNFNMRVRDVIFHHKNMKH